MPFRNRLAVPISLCAAIGAILTGCSSSLDVKKISNEPASGVVYSLPFTQFDIEILRRVASCDDNKLTMSTKLTFKSRMEADAAHMYAIDATSLSGWFNHASAEMTFFTDSIQLKSINVEVQDKTAEIGASILKSIASTAVLAAGFGGPAAACYKPVKEGELSIEEHLAHVKAQEKIVGDYTEEVMQKTKELAAVAKQIAELAPAKDSALEKKQVNMIRSLKASLSTLELEEKTLKAYLKPISHTAKLTWPATGEELHSTNAQLLPMSVLKKWIGKNSVKPEHLLETSVYFKIARTGGYGRDDAAPTVVDSSGALPYRIPTKGEVLACSQMNCKTAKDQSRTTVVNKVHGKLATSIAQLGHINTLPIKTKAFESAKFTAEWSKSGYLSKAGYTKTQSTGEGTSALLDSAVTQYTTYRTAKSAAEQAELDAQLKELETELEIAETTKNVEIAKDDSDDAQLLESLEADTKLLQAKISRLEAEKKLNELENSD